MAEDTYPMPPDGWVCFHCGERFTTPGAAADHFGTTPDATAACRIMAGEERGMVMALRRAEDEIRELKHNECGICGQKTANRRALANHKWLLHHLRG